MAGTETTTTTLRWMVLFMIRLPDIQDRCRKEIHEVISISSHLKISIINNPIYIHI